jgi:N-acetyl-gamma-glutamyl-phosphate reductase
MSTLYIDLKHSFSINKIQNVLQNFHKKNQFVKVLKTNSLISTNNVINTNNCQISVCKTKDKKRLVILSAIDNLIKGGAGQAVQNMNLKFDLKINEGLE